MKNVFLLLAVPALLLASCKKNDDNNNNVNLPAKDRLIGAWIKTSQKTTTTVGSAAPTVENSLPTTCVKNYLYRYAANGNLTAEESDNTSERCDPNGPKVLRTSTWQLLDNDTRLLTFGPSYQTMDTLVVEQLTNTTMRLTKTLTGTLGTDSTKRVFEYTYSKK